MSFDAKSVECLTIRVHFAKDNPKPASAPYLPATVWQAHINNKNPIQLNRKATIINRNRKKKLKVNIKIEMLCKKSCNTNPQSLTCNKILNVLFLKINHKIKMGYPLIIWWT